MVRSGHVLRPANTSFGSLCLVPRLDEKNLSVSRPCVPLLRAVSVSSEGRHERNERMLERPERFVLVLFDRFEFVCRLTSARSFRVAPEVIALAGTRSMTPSIPARTAWVLFWSRDMAVGGLGCSVTEPSSGSSVVGSSAAVDCSAPISGCWAPSVNAVPAADAQPKAASSCLVPAGGGNHR